MYNEEAYIWPFPIFLSTFISSFPVATIAILGFLNTKTFLIPEVTSKPISLELT